MDEGVQGVLRARLAHYLKHWTLAGELFLRVDVMKYVVEHWRMDYNHYRPHSSLSYMIPAGFAQLCREAGRIRPHTPVLNGVQDCGDTALKEGGQITPLQTKFNRNTMEQMKGS